MQYTQEKHCQYNYVGVLLESVSYLLYGQPILIMSVFIY